MEGEDMTTDWGEGLPTPQAVMELLSCDFKKECVRTVVLVSRII